MQHNNSPKRLPIRESPLVLAELADNAYYPHSPIDIPKDFILFLECPEVYQWWGYFGKTYYKINREKKTLEFVIAHRGTDNKFGLIEDIELWLDEILPAQYSAGAYPFMQWAIQEFSHVAAFYPGYEINYQVVGHSLGASLAERTMLDTTSSNVRGLLPPMTAMLFESPGLPYSNMTDELKNHIGANTVLINTRVDAINTLYPPISDHQFHIPIDDAYYPRLENIFPLPLIPSMPYYAFLFTPNVAHPIAGIINFLQNSATKDLLHMRDWPYGFENGFDRYKSFESHQSYWYGYAEQLWFHNGLLSEMVQILFENFNSFFNFYIINFLDPSNENTNDPNERLGELLPSKTIDDIWDQLSSESKLSFQNNPTNFKLWLADYPLQFRPYPYIDAIQFQIKQKVRELLQEGNPNQHLFRALLAVNEELIRCKTTNLNFDEQILVHSTFTHFGLSMANLTLHHPIPQSKQNVTEAPQQSVQINENSTAQEYKKTLLQYLDDQFKHSKLSEGSDKYKDLIKFTERIADKNFATVEEAKKDIADLRQIVSQHREKEGMIGFFNLFRNTESLNRLNKYFDANNDIRSIPSKSPKLKP